MQAKKNLPVGCLSETLAPFLFCIGQCETFMDNESAASLKSIANAAAPLFRAYLYKLRVKQTQKIISCRQKKLCMKNNENLNSILWNNDRILSNPKNTVMILNRIHESALITPRKSFTNKFKSCRRPGSEYAFIFFRRRVTQFENL